MKLVNIIHKNGYGYILDRTLPAGHKYTIVWGNHNQAYTMSYELTGLTLIKESRASLSIFVMSADTTDGTAKQVKVRTWYNDSGPYQYFNSFAIFEDD